MDLSTNLENLSLNNLEEQNISSIDSEGEEIAFDPDILLVRVKINNIYRNVRMNKHKLSVKAFFEQVQAVFDLNITETSGEVKLLDNLRAPVDPAVFPYIVNQYSGDCRFFLEIEADSPTFCKMTHENLLTFLMSQNCGSIIQEERRLKSIGTRSLDKIMDRTADFVQESFGPGQKPDELVQVCLALIQIFPSFKAPNSQCGGIDMLYNRKKASGTLYEKLRARQRKNVLKKQLNQPMENNIDENWNNDQINVVAAFFKVCLLPKDEDAVITKLKETVDLRKIDLQNERIIFNESAHLYSVNPNLICIDYELMFGDKESKSLFEKWAELEPKISLASRDCGPLPDTVRADYDTQLHDVLMLMKIFPSFHVQFMSSLNAMIVLCEDPSKNPIDLINNKSAHPRIISIRDGTNDATKYYITVPGQSIIPNHEMQKVAVKRLTMDF